jgi:hypothetical protein
VIQGVGDVQVAAGIHCHACGPLQHRGCRRTAVAGKSFAAVASDGGDNSIERYFADAIVKRVADVVVSGRIGGYPVRVEQLRIDGWTAIARIVSAAAGGGYDYLGRG